MFNLGDVFMLYQPLMGQFHRVKSSLTMGMHDFSVIMFSIKDTIWTYTLIAYSPCRLDIKQVLQSHLKMILYKLWELLITQS
jgi:hypothetical protein